MVERLAAAPPRWRKGGPPSAGRALELARHRDAANARDFVVEQKAQRIDLIDGVIEPAAAGHHAGGTPPSVVVAPARPILAGTAQSSALDDRRRNRLANPPRGQPALDATVL